MPLKTPNPQNHENQTFQFTPQQQQQHHLPNTVNSSSVGVVSKLKSWFIKPATNPASPPITSHSLLPTWAPSSSSFSSNPTNPMSENCNLMHQPLSIELLRKLRRPVHIPKQLAYSENQTFQGSQLEEWLMNTLDDYIASSSMTNGLNGPQTIQSQSTGSLSCTASASSFTFEVNVSDLNTNTATSIQNTNENGLLGWFFLLIFLFIDKRTINFEFIFISFCSPNHQLSKNIYITIWFGH